MNNSGKAKSSPRGSIILAGGDSKRLGQPKALLDFYGKSLIAHMVEILQISFDQITLVTDRPELYDNLPVKITGDLLKNEMKSPLRGIHAGLSSSSLPFQFVIACDMPFLQPDLIEYMAKYAPDYDAVVPCNGSYYQPLHAYYNRRCIEVIEEQISNGHYKVTDFYSKLTIRYINSAEIAKYDPKELSFVNINTWSDYEQAIAVMAERLKTS